MKVIKFNPDFIKLIQDGKKFETRRPVVDFGKCEYKVDDYVYIDGTDIRLKITSVTTECLNLIDRRGLLFEGAAPIEEILANEEAVKVGFFLLWDEIYKEKPQYQSINNPKVWVIHFKIDKPEMHDDADIVCPYCGVDHEDYDYDHVSSTDEEFECCFCNREFLVTGETTVTYTSKVKPGWKAKHEDDE